MPLLSSLLGPLGGQMFVLGGEKTDIGPKGLGFFSNDVYVLDLAGQKQWKRCASMKQARGTVGGAVLNGKNYVFGGRQRTFGNNGNSLGEPVCGSEMYDPQENTWTSIKAMPTWRFGHHVIQAGPVLVIYGGFIFRPEQLGSIVGKYSIFSGNSLEIYDPVKDSWKVVLPKSNEV